MDDNKFHKIEGNLSGIKMPERFTFPFYYIPHPLVRLAAASLRRYLNCRNEWQSELMAGKMIGVLVVRNSEGKLGYLAAFSGNLAHANNHFYFVPAVYDILQPDGVFKTKEAEITEINHRIAAAEQSVERKTLDKTLAAACSARDKEVAAYKALMAKSKQERDQKRLDGSDCASLIAESQFQKAELRRIKQRHKEAIDAIAAQRDAIDAEIASMKKLRHAMSEQLQRWIFDQFVMVNARGERKTLTDIFADARGEMPPAGAGECAAPKLLQYALTNGYTPLAMGEFWIGRSPVGEVRHDGFFYGACKSKCEPILNFMMQGLDVESNPLKGGSDLESRLRTVYEDDCLWVVDKPSGMLSAPGKDGTLSVTDVARRRFPQSQGLMVVHRLDQHTSGLLIVAKTTEAFSALRQQFEHHEVEKAYIALLDGNVPDNEGLIRLPLSADYHDRPRQRVDFDGGKEAVTHYRVIGRFGDTTRVEFRPLTGRTHQLRVHSAFSRPDGLGAPIHGDALYGCADVRLCLHASYIRFSHPTTGEILAFSSTPDF